MARHALLKSILAPDKIILEFSRQGLLAEVQAYNQIVMRCHRKDHRETWPLVFVVDEPAFLKYVYKHLLKGELPGTDDVAKSFAYHLHEILDLAPCRQAGILKRQPSRQQKAQWKKRKK